LIYEFKPLKYCTLNCQIYNYLLLFFIPISRTKANNFCYLDSFSNDFGILYVISYSMFREMQSQFSPAVALKAHRGLEAELLHSSLTWNLLKICDQLLPLETLPPGKQTTVCPRTGSDFWLLKLIPGSKQCKDEYVILTITVIRVIT
jgi:hypothetical protein